MKYKIYAITMCFNEADIIEESITQLYSTKSDDTELVHVLLDQHWPINYSKNKKVFIKLNKEFNCIILDAGKNLGLSGGFNYCFDYLKPHPNSLTIGYDPDTFPVTQNWDMAMCEVYERDPSVAWISLMNKTSYRELVEERHGSKPYELNNLKLIEVNRPVVNSICAFRSSFLYQTNGLSEPNEFYGGLEIQMFKKLKELQKKWVFLCDFEEIDYFSSRVHPLYRVWKYGYAHRHFTKKDFASWLWSDDFERALNEHKDLFVVFNAL